MSFVGTAVIGMDFSGTDAVEGMVFSSPAYNGMTVSSSLVCVLAQFLLLWTTENDGLFTSDGNYIMLK